MTGKQRKQSVYIENEPLNLVLVLLGCIHFDTLLAEKS